MNVEETWTAPMTDIRFAASAPPGLFAAGRPTAAMESRFFFCTLPVVA